MAKKNILVVDDGITIRKYYRDVLERAGFAVDEAVNGVEGLERALLVPFDLMVVDINMPKMDGYELIRQVRKEPSLRAVPTLTISTEDRDEDARRAYEAGTNLYLVKPVRPEELTAAARLFTGSAS